MAKKDSGEEILKAILEKGGQSTKGKEALEKAAAELQAATKSISEAADTQKAAAQKQSAAATMQQETAAKQKSSKPSDVSKLTQKIAGAPGASAAGVASTVGSAIKEQTIGSAFSIRGMTAALSESLGLKGLGLALGSITEKRGEKGGAVQTKQLDTLSSILDITKDNKEVLLSILDAIKGNQIQNIEAQREAAAAVQQTNTGAGRQEKSGGLFNALIAGLAAALGTIVGIFKGWIRALQAFGETLIPKSIIQLIQSKFAAIGTFVDDVIVRLKSVFTGAVDGVGKSFKTIGQYADDAVLAIKNSFSAITKSETLANTVKFLSNSINGLVKPFQEAYVVISELTSSTVSKIPALFAKIGEVLKPILGVAESIGGVFTDIFGGLSKFGGIFKSVASVVGKLFAPLAIILTVWDTVKGAIEGFEQDGIVGAIAGAVKGLFNSLISMPLDLIKSAVSWLAGVFGFDKAKELLDSFSFEDMFNKFIDGFVATGKYVVNYVTEAVPKLIDKFKEWWDSFSIVEPIIETFTKMKDMIVNKISSIADGITGFFKDLPGNLVNSLPDGMIKNSLMKFIGGSKGPEKEAEAPSPSNYEKYKEMGRKNVTEFMSSDIAAHPIYGPGAIAAFKEGQAEAGITPVENPRAMGVVTSSNKNALEASITSAPPVIVNNVTNNTTAPSGSASPRVSGAVSTAPAPSHLDRTLYGTVYGGGYL